MNKSIALVGGMILLGGLAQTGRAQSALERLEEEVRGLVNQQPTEASEVEAGYLGILADDRNEKSTGVRIVRVFEGGPAGLAGLREGDVVTEVDGRRVRGVEEFAEMLAGLPPGERLLLAVEREGDVQRIEVRLGRRPPPEAQPIEEARAGEALPGAQSESLPPPRHERGQNLVGLRVTTLDRAAAARLGLGVSRGALVIEVSEGSPAQHAGLPVEAVIVALNGKRIDTAAELARLVLEAGPGSEISLAYYHRGKLFERQLTLASADPSGDLDPVKALAPAEPADRRIEMLERRVRELEARIAELERMIGER